MPKTIVTFFLIVIAQFYVAQETKFLLTRDTVRTLVYDPVAYKTITQEIGFNTVSLVKQLISNNPAQTLQQLPYDIFYNVYYKDLIGLRVGLGLVNQRFETSITGQTEPRTTDQNNLNLRAGVSYNFLKTPRLAFNVYGDVLIAKDKFETVTTTTLVQFPNPIVTQTIKTSNLSTGRGAAVGVGVKYNIIKHLSVYIEVPVMLMSQKINSMVSINTSGIIDLSEDASTTRTTRIILPTTIYLVLRF